MWGYMAYYVPPSKKVGRHVPRVLHQIAPMSTVNFLSTNYVLSLTILITSKLSFLRFLLPQLQPPPLEKSWLRPWSCFAVLDYRLVALVKQKVMH